MSDSTSLQVSRTRLRILTVLSKAVIWIVSTRRPNSKSSRSFNNLFVIVPKAPHTIGTIVTFMFHSVFNSLSRSRNLSFFSHSFGFILWSAGRAKSKILQILFFFCWSLLGLLFWTRLGDLCVCQNPIGVYVCHFSRTGVGLCIYHLFVCWNLNFLHISQWITLPTQSCLALYTFCANLLHSLIMWLMVSSLSPHSLRFSNL